MKVEIVATGDVVETPRNPLLVLLERANIIRYLPEPTPVKLQAALTWTLERTPSSGALNVHVRCSCGSADMRNFNPKPDFCFRHCNVFEVMPADLYAKGKAEWAKNAAADAKLRATQAKNADRQYHLNPKTGAVEFRP